MQGSRVALPQVTQLKHLRLRQAQQEDSNTCPADGRVQHTVRTTQPAPREHGAAACSHAAPWQQACSAHLVADLSPERERLQDVVVLQAGGTESGAVRCTGVEGASAIERKCRVHSFGPLATAGGSQRLLHSSTQPSQRAAASEATHLPLVAVREPRALRAALCKFRNRRATAVSAGTACTGHSCARQHSMRRPQLCASAQYAHAMAFVCAAGSRQCRNCPTRPCFAP